ncbi:MAG: chitobiase/beta-hexosaminidase C-terminal domain-containing protein [Terracidiphilus sp.]
MYGTLGTPAAGDLPGSRSFAATWTDTSGNLWLFGGSGYDANGNTGELNDLWEFNPSTREWAWMGGSSTIGSDGGQFGVYGTLGTPAAGNIPGGRFDAVTWTDNKGRLWLYGGRGTSADYGPNLWLNDLWEFDPSTGEWTWMGGDSSTGGLDSLPGVYGTLGTPAAGNNPGSREGAVSWTDNKGNLWLFGGNNDGMFLNDLWEFNPFTNEWAWMGGSSTAPASCTPADCSLSGIYGELGTPAAGNNPGARFWASSWTDKNGNFWLFGGYGYDSVANLGYLNDLWEFNPSTNEWTWMSGSSTVPGFNEGGQPGVYGTLGTPAAGNVPGGRYGASSWTDSRDNLWLFGGNDNGFQNDLWEFNPSTSEWTWMGGSSVFDNSCFGVFGTLGDPAEGNIPGSRYAASSWTDSTGSFWLFGGEGPLPVDGEWFLFSLSDFWKYQPAVTTAFTNAATPTFSVAAGTYTSTQTVTISDATAEATIYYTTDGSTPTINSSIYSGPLTVSLYSTTETVNAMAVAANYFNSAVASATYVINLPPSSGTVTTIASSLNPSNVGEYVTFTATVYPVSSSSTPAGTAQFSAYGAPLGSPVALNSSGVATYTTAALFAGGASVTATYTPASGSSFAPSTSSPLQQYVAGPCAGSSSTTLTSSQNPSNTGQSVTFTATVAPGVFPACAVGGGPPLNSGTYAPRGIYGTVQFTVNGTAMGPQIPVGGGGNTGVATYSTSTLPAGTDAITAIFTEGNGYVGSSESAPLSQVVTGTGTTQAATPTFSLASGTYTTAQTVTISDATAAATVYYTTDGTAPTTNSNIYSNSITVSSTETLTAMATANGYYNSAVASETYTINLSTPDFSVAATPASLTLTAGQSGTTGVSVTPLNGFNSAVSFSCSGLPSGASCAFSPATVTPSGDATSTMLTVTTSATTTAALQRNSRPLFPAAALALVLCGLGWKKRRRLQTMLLLAVSVFGLSLLTSCSAAPAGPPIVLDPVTSTVSVTATAGSIQHTTSFLLTVN